LVWLALSPVWLFNPPYMANGKAGRPRKPVNEALLRKMIAEGLSLKQIASLLEVSEDTLVRNFAPLVRPLLHPSDGRPQKTIDENKVRKLAAIGLSAEEIGALFDVSGDTILRRFEEELKTGPQKRNANLKSELYRRAMNGKSDVALIFALKAWCAMNDRPTTSEQMRPTNWFYETIRIQRELLATQKQNALGNASPPAPPTLSFGGIAFEPSDADLDVADAESEPVPTPQDPMNGEQQLPVAD